MEEYCIAAELTVHHGRQVLVERDPIELIKIPVLGQAITQSILLHPQYAPNGIPYERIAVCGFVRGRTLDILLDEPMIIDGEAYPVLTFKGVGADANRRLVIPIKVVRQP